MVIILFSTFVVIKLKISSRQNGYIGDRRVDPTEHVSVSDQFMFLQKKKLNGKMKIVIHKQLIIKRLYLNIMQVFVIYRFF